MKPSKRLNLAAETYVLLAICLVDLVSTLWLISSNRAIEGNPFMAFYMAKGLWALAAAKISIALFSLSVVEWGRRYKPRFVLGVLRFAIIAYIGIYAVAFVNSNVLAAQRMPPSYLDTTIEQDIGVFDENNPGIYQP